MTNITWREHTIVAVIWLPLGIAVSALLYYGLGLQDAWRRPEFWIINAGMLALVVAGRRSLQRWEARNS